MGFLARRGISAGSSEDPVPSGAYYVDKASGNDANDGHLVAENGSGPWATLDKALTEAAAGTFDLVNAAGDIHVVFRNTGDGIYAVTGHTLEGGGSTTLVRKIRFRTHPDDSPVTFSTDTGSEQATGIITMGSSNYSFERMYWICDEQFITSVNAANSGKGWRIRKVTQLWSGTSYSVDNHGVIRFNNDDVPGGNGGGNYDDWEILDSSFEGNASPHPNGATFYFEQVNSRITFRNCVIKNQGVGQVIYFKHPPQSDPGVGQNVSFENCVIHGEASSARGVIYGGPVRVEYENCLVLWESTTSRALHITTSVDGAGYSGAHANILSHVTFWSANTTNGGIVDFDDDQGAATAGTDNVVTKCVFVTAVLQIGEGGSYTHNTTLDDNLYQSTGDAVRQFATGYSLAAWQSAYSQDASSVEEDAIFAVTPDPTDYTTFALGASSQGKNAASDGEDMGFYDASWLSSIGATA